jgi:hypothetical protein
MKERFVTYLALALSIVAIGYAGCVHFSAAKLAEDALRRREERLVKHFAPTFGEIYADLLPDGGRSVKNAKTLEELFGPALDIVKKLGNSSTNSADSSTKKELSR